MTELIGPNTCGECGGDYGGHHSGCSRLHPVEPLKLRFIKKYKITCEEEPAIEIFVTVACLEDARKKLRDFFTSVQELGYEETKEQ